MYKMIPIGLFVVLLLRSFSFRAFATICYWPFKPFVAVVICYCCCCWPLARKLLSVNDIFMFFNVVYALRLRGLFVCTAEWWPGGKQVQLEKQLEHGHEANAVQLRFPCVSGSYLAFEMLQTCRQFVLLSN